MGARIAGVLKLRFQDGWSSQLALHAESQARPRFASRVTKTRQFSHSNNPIPVHTITLLGLRDPSLDFCPSLGRLALYYLLRACCQHIFRVYIPGVVQNTTPSVQWPQTLTIRIVFGRPTGFRRRNRCFLLLSLLRRPHKRQQMEILLYPRQASRSKTETKPRLLMRFCTLM